MSPFFISAVGGLAVGRRHGDADAGAELDHLAVDRERRLHRLDDALGNGRGVAVTGDRRQEQGELVAAEAGEEIGLARRAPEPCRGLLQHLVADGVAMRVVDRLEVVEVDAEHRRLVAARQRRFHPGHMLEELGAVGQLGQRVVARQMLDPRFLLALLGDVLVRRDPAAVLHRMVLHQDDAAVELVDVLAVLAARDHLAAPADVVLARAARRAHADVEEVGENVLELRCPAGSASSGRP